VRQQRELRDRQVARVVRETIKLPGYNVFKYINGDDKPVVVTRRHINDYIKEVMGSSFSAKDFRTWAGTLVCACALARNGVEIPEKKTARNKRIVEAIKETAKCLGTRRRLSRLLRLSGDHQLVREGPGDRHLYTKLDDLIAFRGRGLHKAEQCVWLRFSEEGRLINGRSIKRNTGRRSSVEVWRRMHFHDSDFYYRVLGAGIRELLKLGQD
jgi:DNA topoisomerase-1